MARHLFVFLSLALVGFAIAQTWEYGVLVVSHKEDIEGGVNATMTVWLTDTQRLSGSSGGDTSAASFCERLMDAPCATGDSMLQVFDYLGSRGWEMVAALSPEAVSADALGTGPAEFTVSRFYFKRPAN